MKSFIIIIDCENKPLEDGSWRVLAHRDLIRCKDCKYCNKYDYVCEHPNEWGNEDTRNQRNLDWFCADGEAKE